jgi:hypothetical protein
MPRQNHPSANTPTPMTLSAAQSLLLLKKKPVLAMPSPELWGPPLPRPATTSEPGTRSSPSPPTEPPSPGMNSTLLCSVSPLRLREPSDRQSLRPLATTSSAKPRGKSATTSPSRRPRLIAFVMLSQSVRPVPHLDLSRLDRAMGPRRSWQEVVQEVERSATCTCPGSTADAQEAGDRVAAVARDPGEEELFPAEHPFIRLEPATLLNDMPHLYNTDGTPLFKGNVSHTLLHAYSHPSAKRDPTSLHPVLSITAAIATSLSSPPTTASDSQSTSFRPF